MHKPHMTYVSKSGRMWPSGRTAVLPGTRQFFAHIGKLWIQVTWR